MEHIDQREYGESETEQTQEGSSPDKQHRFSFIEGFFLIAFNAIGDALELLDLTGVGVIVGFLVDALIGLPTILYLYLKGVPRVVSKNALANGVEMIPFVDILPIRTTIIILTILATNNPEKWGKFMGIAKTVSSRKTSVKK